MATAEQVAEIRNEVEALRQKVAEERAAMVKQSIESSNDFAVTNLEQERARLEAELASLRGETVTTNIPKVNGYEVPMGTVAVDTDVVKVREDDAVEAAPAVAPPPPADFSFINDAD